MIHIPCALKGHGRMHTQPYGNGRKAPLDLGRNLLVELFDVLRLPKGAVVLIARMATRPFCLY
jgi:hypothetical protein